MQADPKQIKAKNFLVTLFVAFVIIDILTIIAAKDFFAGGVRVLLTVTLMCFVVSGFKWAKWITVGLFSLAGCITFVLFIPQLQHASILAAAFLAVGVLFFLIAAFLVFGKNLNGYFNYRREVRNL